MLKTPMDKWRGINKAEPSTDGAGFTVARCGVFLVARSWKDGEEWVVEGAERRGRPRLRSMSSVFSLCVG